MNREEERKILESGGQIFRGVKKEVGSPCSKCSTPLIKSYDKNGSPWCKPCWKKLNP